MITGSCHCDAAGWTLEGGSGVVTACNCTLCRRYGVQWAYDYENSRIRISGPTSTYTRTDRETPSIEIRFCPTCGCVICWRGPAVRPDGGRRMAVNVRLAPPEGIAHLPIDHLDLSSAAESL
jgi:hypothetical protein